MMGYFNVFFLFIFCGFLLTHHHHGVQGQANKVSSKLDFDENENNNQTGVLGQGQGQQGGNGSYDQGTGRSLSGGNTGGGGGGGEGGGGSSGGGGGGSGNSGNRPKIHGVRVTVDTGNGQQQTKESKESVEITDLGKHKKRVGIHTDITFEITAEGEGNETSSAQQQGEKEDASVPIYKGRGGSESKHRNRKPYDPKSQWNPNFSSEHRGYETGGSRTGTGTGTGRGGAGGYYTPQYYPQEVYANGGSGNSETWTHYVPVWTTERSPQEQSQIYRRPSWKPCYCMSSYGYGSDFRRRRDNKAIRDQSSKGLINSGVIQVDGKLERPFS